MKRLLLVMPALAGAAAAPARAEDQSPREPSVEMRPMAAAPAGDRQPLTEVKRVHEPALGFDPLNLQPPDVRDLLAVVESAAPEKTVAARFDSAAHARHVVRYVYVRENGVWRLDDISGENGPDKWSLRAPLDPDADR